MNMFGGVNLNFNRRTQQALTISGIDDLHDYEDLCQPYPDICTTLSTSYPAITEFLCGYHSVDNVSRWICYIHSDEIFE